MLELDNDSKIDKQYFYSNNQSDTIKNKINEIKNNNSLYNNTKINYNETQKGTNVRGKLISYRKNITDTIKLDKDIKLGDLCDINKVNIDTDDNYLSYLENLFIGIKQITKIIKDNKSR